MTVAEPLRAPRKVPHPTAGTNLWTFPMHPQVQKAGPGSCPICGMALEPMTPAGGEAANPELRDMTRRFWVLRDIRGQVQVNSRATLQLEVVSAFVLQDLRGPAYAAGKIYER
jgi:hypothetical protein